MAYRKKKKKSHSRRWGYQWNKLMESHPTWIIDNMLMNIYSCAKAKTTFFLIIFFFLVCYCLQRLKYLSTLLRLMIKILINLEVLFLNFANFLCDYLLSVLTFLILMKMSYKVDLSPWMKVAQLGLKSEFLLNCSWIRLVRLLYVSCYFYILLVWMSQWSAAR